VGVARGAVAVQGLGNQRKAGIGHAQTFAAVGVQQALDPAAGQQLDLDEILARPAGTAPELAQALDMDTAGRGHGVIFAPECKKPPAGGRGGLGFEALRVYGRSRLGRPARPGTGRLVEAVVAVLGTAKKVQTLPVGKFKLELV